MEGGIGLGPHVEVAADVDEVLHLDVCELGILRNLREDGMVGWGGPRKLMCDVVYGAIGLAHIDEAANGGEALHFDF